MTQRALLAIAAAVTAFVLVLFAVVLPGLSSTGATPAPTAVALPAQTDPGIGSQPQTAPPTATLVQSAPFSYAVSVEQAGAFALTATTGATLTGAPELVTYQGVVAYEVPLSTGFAYVDATSGQVLAAPDTTVGSSLTPAGDDDKHEGREYDDDEHEGREHEGREHEGREHDDD